MSLMRTPALDQDDAGEGHSKDDDAAAAPQLPGAGGDQAKEEEILPADAADGSSPKAKSHTGKDRRKRVSLELDIDWSSVPKRETVEVDDEVEVIEVTDITGGGDTDGGDAAKASTQDAVAVQQQQPQQPQQPKPPKPAPRRARAKTYGADRKKKTFKGAALMIRNTKKAELAFASKGATGDDEDADVPAVPRPHRAAMVPIIIALVVGLAGLFMIYGLAANLGAENTKVWLIAATTAFVNQMFLMQPAKVLLATGLMKCADEFRSDTLDRIAGALDNV
jgi:hypothetical protein